MSDTAILPPAILLMGPTASGKTDLALELVRRFPVEIVSVDSALVYRGMDIGTAKPAPDILAEAPHRLIDILDPAQSYSAAQFREDALREMADIVAAGRIPLLVGGTLLYFRALEGGLSDLPGADPEAHATVWWISGDALHSAVLQQAEGPVATPSPSPTPKATATPKPEKTKKPKKTPKP